MTGCTFGAVAASSQAAVTLSFSNVGLTTAVATVPPGGVFTFSVNLVETAAGDKATGADYQVQASTSNVVEFLKRDSSVGQFPSPNGYSDAYLNSSSYSPHVLSPLNGTDLGTSLDDPSASVSGPGTSDLSDYSFKVLPGTPLGTYTLSFADADYTGAPPTFNTVPLTPTATFTFNVGTSVPEPAAACLATLAAASLAFRRRH